MLRCQVSTLKDTILPLIEENLPVLIHGDSGIGKTEIVIREIAPALEEKYGSCVVKDYRVSTWDTVDATGLPDLKNGATRWARPAFIPKDDGKMYLYYFSELTHASIPVQHVLYRIVNERASGDYQLPKNHRIIADCNTREARGGDNRLLGPFENRFCHVLAQTSPADFISIGKRRGFEMALLGFIERRPELLHKMSEGPAWPSPRNWERINKIWHTPNFDDLAQAVVGEGAAREVSEFRRTAMSEIPKLKEIESNPEKCKVPKETQYQYVVASGIARHMTEENWKPFKRYLQRLPADISSMAANLISGRDEKLGKHVGDLVI
jgi:hypothetical protein